MKKFKVQDMNGKVIVHSDKDLMSMVEFLTRGMDSFTATYDLKRGTADIYTVQGDNMPFLFVDEVHELGRYPNEVK